MGAKSLEGSSLPIIPLRDVKYHALGLHLLKQLAAEGRRIFALGELHLLAKEVGLAERELLLALEHLHSEGWVTKIRREVFAITTAVPPAEPAHPFEIAMKLVDPAAISHWTALYYHGLVREPAPSIYVMTHTGTPLPRLRSKKGKLLPYCVTGISYQFVQMKPARYFGISSILLRDSMISITDPERTLLDAIMMPQHCGGVLQTLTAFHARGKDLNLKRMTEYALRVEVATAKRLGWILEKERWNLKALRPLLELPIKGFRKLDPSAPQRGPYCKRWMIQENLLDRSKL